MLPTPEPTEERSASVLVHAVAALQNYQVSTLFAADIKKLWSSSKTVTPEWTHGLTAFRAWAKSKGKIVPEKKSFIKSFFEGELGTIYNNTIRGQKLYGWKHIRLVE